MTNDTGTNYPPEGWEEVPGGGLKRIVEPSEPSKMLELITGGADDVADGTEDDDRVKVGGRSVKAADVLLEILFEKYTGGVSDEGDVFAVPRDGARWARLLNRQGFELRHDALAEFYRMFKLTPPSNAAKDALAVFEALARQSEEPRQKLHLRYARSGSSLVVDLGGPDARVVDITPSGWRIRNQNASDPLFRRPQKLRAMGDPVQGDGFKGLKGLINATPDDIELVTAWLTAGMFPDHPHPMLLLDAEQGSGKTTLANALLSVLDPGAKAGTPPKNDRSWEVKLTQSYAVGFDNLSSISTADSDNLARAVTGDEVDRRRLFTDDEMISFQILIRVVATTIGLSSIRGDLADRTLPVELKELAEGDFISEEQAAELVKSLAPATLGSMFDLASKILAELPNVGNPPLPRMASFGRFLVAVDKATGTSTLDRYLNARQRIFEATLDSQRLWPYLQSEVFKRGGTWEASASDIRDALLTRLRIEGDGAKAILHEAEGPTGQLRSAQTTGTWMRRISVALTEKGWTCLRRAGHGEGRRWFISTPEEGVDDELVGEEVS